MISQDNTVYNYLDQLIQSITIKIWEDNFNNLIVTIMEGDLNVRFLRVVASRRSLPNKKFHGRWEEIEQKVPHACICIVPSRQWNWWKIIACELLST